MNVQVSIVLFNPPSRYIYVADGVVYCENRELSIMGPASFKVNLELDR